MRSQRFIPSIPRQRQLSHIVVTLTPDETIKVDATRGELTREQWARELLLDGLDLELDRLERQRQCREWDADVAREMSDKRLAAELLIVSGKSRRHTDR